MRMIKYLFEQAWSQLKLQPLLTAVSILGTALTICLIMVIVMQQQITLVPFAPESNRDRLLHIKYLSVDRKKGGEYVTFRNGLVGCNVAKACFKDLKSAEAVTAYSMILTMQIKLPLTMGQGVDVKQTDASFFQVFDFSFVDGKPYVKAETRLPVAVITESVAKHLYNTTAASGREMLINEVPYRIVGVVKDVSSLAPIAYAQVWIPLQSTQINPSSWLDGVSGDLGIAILAKQKSDFEAIRIECDSNIKAYNTTIGDHRIHFRGQPDDQLTMSQRNSSNQGPDMTGYFSNLLIVILILLLVPAINLSSMTQSRLRQRVAEIGVRRSFGATRGEIMGQIIAENLVLTFIAALVGLAFGFLLASVWGSSLFAEARMMYLNTAPTVEWRMLFNLSTFIYALFFSLLLNLLSSGLPAWKASKVSIVNALTGTTD